MKRLTAILLVLVLPLVALCSRVPSGEAFAENAVLDKGCYCVMEKSSGRILCENLGNVRREPASTTKIMTALCAIESGLDLIVPREIPVSAVGVEGSSIYLKHGEKMSLLDLLYGLMLCSGNDSAVAIAVMTAGSVAAFCDKMNERARELELFGTHFDNPHGLGSENHYTTARDLCRLAVEAMKNPLFCEIVSTRRYICEHGIFVNKNKMLYGFSGANGVKTGYTKSAGRCLVSSAERNGMTLVSAVLFEQDMWNKSAELLENCFSKYRLVRLAKKGECGKVKTRLPWKKIAVGLNEDVYYPLQKEEENAVSTRVVLPSLLPIGVKENEAVGRLEIYCENKLLFSRKLFTMNI